MSIFPLSFRQRMVGYTALLQADERLGLERDRYVSALESYHDAFDGRRGTSRVSFPAV